MKTCFSHRLIAVLMAIVVLAATLPLASITAFAVENTPYSPLVSITPDAERVELEEEITFVVALNHFALSKGAVAIELYFDAEVFELVEGAWAIQGFVTHFDPAKLQGALAWMPPAPSEVNGTVFTFTLRAKAVADATEVGCVIKEQVLGDFYAQPAVITTYTLTCPHEYDNACDATCNLCGETRDTSHTYTDVCDATCNVCGAERVAPHAFEEVWSLDDDTHWHECTNCDAVTATEAHVFDHACDTICNVCGATREITHTYDNACDTACNVCGATREITHTYTDVCDPMCNVCGDVRVAPHAFAQTWSSNATNHWHACANCAAATDVAAHAYDNACDTTCNVCEYVREITHTYDNACDTACNVCGATREITHTYTDVCDATCNVCGAERIAPHAFAEAWTNDAANHWHACANCDAVTGTAVHEYDNTCDTTCNVCGYVREITHTYTDVCDAICDVCGFERVAPHAFAEAWTNDDTNHWHACEKCDATTAPVAHVYAPERPHMCADCEYVLYIPGDANNDNTLDANDVLYLFNSTEEGGEEEYPVQYDADYNKDGEVDKADVLVLLFNIVFGDGKYPLF